MSSNRPVRSKRKGWARLYGCFCAGDHPLDEIPNPAERSFPSDRTAAPVQLHSRPQQHPTTAVHSTAHDTPAWTAANEGDAQSVKILSSDFELWDKALECLKESQEDPDIVAIIQGFAKNPAGNNATTDGELSSVAGLAKDIKEKMEQEVNDQQHDREQRAWKMKIGQNEYSVCGFVEKTVTVLNKFVAVGDVAVSFDPVHAALPWAAVRFVLVSLTAHSELRSQIIFGLAKVTSLVLQCDTYRRLYMAPDPDLRPPEKVLSPLEGSIVHAYVKSLLFLGFAVQRQRSKSNVVSAPFKLGDVEPYVKNLVESGDQLAQAADNCEKQCSHQNRANLEELLKTAKESHRAIQDRAVLLFNIHQKIILGKLTTAEGAAYNSHANEHDARCHPHTRVDLLAQIYKWADDPDGECIYWLQGMAGTGKSTISRTVAHEFAYKEALGASFFFKRGEGDRGKAARFFTTITTQLVHRLHSLAPHVQNAIEADSCIGEKTMKEQFEKLITQPLEKMGSDPQNRLTMVVVIDALDECDNENDTQALIGLLPQAKQLTSVRLKFFVTSRPEFPIRLEFNKISGTYQDLALHRVDERVIEDDISTFLMSDLSRTRDDYNRLVATDRQLSPDWPGQTNLQILVKMSIPLFIFASTICRFLKDWKHGRHPDKKLTEILKYQTRSQTSKLDATYSPVLNQLLLDFSGPAKDDVVQDFREVVGPIIILASPLSTTSLSHLLGIPKQDIDCGLDPLHSVLNIPSNSDAPVKLLHLSFRDFLVDPDKRNTNPFWVDEEKTHEKLATRCLQLLTEADHLKKDICGPHMPGRTRMDIGKKIIDSCLPPEVQYACLYWVYHLKGSKSMVQDGDQAHQFLKCHFLHWLEALSLIERISESIGLIDELQSMVDPIRGTEALSFLRDAKRFVLNYRSVIDMTPLQLYASALIFAPDQSIIRRTFEHYIPRWVSPLPHVDSNWNAVLQTLEGHKGEVYSVVFSRDDKLIASGSDDSTIKVWDVATGSEVQTLKGHTGGVCSVVFSCDDKLIASGSHDKTVKVWDVATGGEVRALKGYIGGVWSVVFSRDDKLIASGSDDTIKVWDVATGDEVRTLKGHTGEVNSVVFSYDSQLIASGSDDNTIKVWDVATGGEVRTLKGHTDWVRSVVFSCDDKLIASGSRDKTVRVWDVATGSEVRALESHTGGILSVIFSRDSKLIISGSYNNIIKIWDVATGREVRTLEGHTGRVYSAVFSRNDTLIASGSNDKTIKIWDVATGGEVRALEGHTSRVSSVVFSRDGKLIISGSDDAIKVWDVATGSEVRTLEGHTGRVYSAVFSRNDTLIASGSNDKTIKIWDVATGDEVRALEGHTNWVSSVVFSRDGKLIASGSGDNTIKVWDVATGDEVRALEGHMSWVSSVVFSRDSKLIASGSHDNIIKVWDVATGDEVRTLDCQIGGVCSVVFSYDSQLIASGSGDNTIKIWDIATGGEIRTLDGHTGGVYSAVFSRDDTLIASGSYDNTIKVWDVATGDEVQSFKTGPLTQNLSFADDGSFLVTNIGRFSLGSSDTCVMYMNGDETWNGERDGGRETQGDGDTKLGYGIKRDGKWVTADGPDGHKVLWLPPDFRPGSSAISTSGSTVAIGCPSGRVVIMGFSKDISFE